MTPLGCGAVSSPPTRRSVLRIGSGGALALVIGGAAGWLDRRDPDDSPDASATTTIPTTTTTAGPVVIPSIGTVDGGIILLGRRVVDVTGWDDVGELLADVPEPERDPIAQAAAIVRDEFAGGDTIAVDGWVLARSEARAAAAVALICDDAC